MNDVEAGENWLYSWGVEDSAREILAGFPFLAQIENPLAERAMAFMNFVGREEAKRMARVIIATAHKRDVSALDQLLVEQFRSWEFRQNVSEPDYDQWPIARIRLRDQLRSRFRTPEYEFVDSSSHCVIKSKVRGCTLETRIDMRGRLHAVTYEHILYDQSSVLLRTSVLSWMGISGQTYWSHLNSTTAVSAGTLIFELSRHFLRALDTASFLRKRMTAK